MLKDELARAFRRRSRAEWTAVFSGLDACVTPVRSLAEAPADPQIAARSALVERDGEVHPAAAPRLSRTPLPGPADPVDARSMLAGWGVPTTAVTPA